MFETLDDTRFAGIAATYGPATDAPKRLRALADDDPDVAVNALYWVEGDYFHQDLYCEATPLTVPYLLEIAQRPSVVQAAVIRMLGRMVRGGADAPNDLAPYAPRPPRGTNDAATRSAIEAAAPMLLALLEAANPVVRCAAIWTCAGLGPAARSSLVARLRIESDRRARICGWIALNTLGQPLADVTTEVLAAAGAAPAPRPHEVAEADVLAVLGAERPVDAVVEDAFVRLLGAEQQSWLPFAAGRVSDVATHHLRRLGREEPKLGLILQRVLSAERGVARDAEAMLAWAVFPDGVPRHASALTEPQRWALLNVWIGEARGVRLANDDLEGQRAFVQADGPLDEVVSYRRLLRIRRTARRTPLDDDSGVAPPRRCLSIACVGRLGLANRWAHSARRLYAQHTPGDHTRTVAEHILANPEGAEAFLREHTLKLADARTFQLALAITRGDLGDPAALVDAVVRTCAQSVTLERTLAYLATADPALPQHVVALLLSPYLPHGLPSPAPLDPLAVRWLASVGSSGSTWLRTFPPQRRVDIVAELAPRGMIFWPLCDATALGAAVLDRFAATPPRADASALLAVPSAILRERCPSIADASKREKIEHELNARIARTDISLSARRIHAMTLEVMLPQGTRLAQLLVDDAHTGNDLEAIRQVVRDYPNAQVTLYTATLPEWIWETLRAELGDRVVLR